MKEIDRGTAIKIVAGIVVLGGFIYAYLAYFWIPMTKKIKDMEGKISLTEVEIKKAKQIIEKVGDLKAKLDELDRQKTELEKKIPAERDISELFKIVKKLADKNSIEINSINPMATVSDVYYFKISYSMTIRGKYHNIGRFIGDIAKSERILNVENLSIGGEDTPIANFILVSYQYKGIQ